MVAVFASKFLGLIRDRLLVHNFNTSDAAIFFAAFKLPDLIFQLLIFGALSVAFIPVYTEYLNQKGDDEASEFASNILNLSLIFYTGITIFTFFFVSQLNSILIPGFSGAQKDLTDQLTRVILFSQVLLLIGSFMIGVAQSYQRFIISALAPIFYNLGIIFGIAYLSRFFGIMGPAWGVILGAALHVLVQLPQLKSLGFTYKPSFNFKDAGVRQVFKMMSIRNIGLAVEQISDAIGIALASLISYSSVTLLTFSQHLYFVPIGLFGTTIAQAALPVLAREQAKGETESFKITFLTTMHQILFLTLPVAAILIVLRIPVVRLTFGASQFNWADTVLTGRTVAFMAAALAAQSAILLIVRAFYALKDTKTPVSVSLVTVLLNICLSLIFVKLLFWDVWGLGFAYAVSTNVSFFLLLFFLSKKVGGFNRADLVNPALKMLLASVVAAIALYIPIKALDQLVFDTTKTVNLIALTSIASIFGLAIYFVLVWLMRVKELDTFVGLAKSIGKRMQRVKIEEIVSDIDQV